MGLTLYVPDDVVDPYLIDARGVQDDARESMVEVLDENAPEVDRD